MIVFVMLGNIMECFTEIRAMKMVAVVISKVIEELVSSMTVYVTMPMMIMLTESMTEMLNVNMGMMSMTVMASHFRFSS